MIHDVTHRVRAVLVHINFRNSRFNEELDEFILLADSCHIDAVTTVNGTRSIPDARYFIGTGKVSELAGLVKTHDAELIIFNHELTPAQERNVEKAVNCRVLDRVGLILDIFAQRARTHEGKLQVELAQLQHLSTRLVRGWSHLERQKGGIGLRGPGETQLETDRRLLRKRIKSINARLASVKRQRQQSRRLRKKSQIPLVSLIGYTNAGKSTLFNALSGADVYAVDKLFATLDPTIRKVDLSDNFSILLSDTVGFIRHIPHDLIESFHATLEEVQEADLLLHVIDITEDSQLRIDEVNNVINTLGASSIPQIVVYNKADLCDESMTTVLRQNGGIPRVRVSARSGDGMSGLRKVIIDQIQGSTCHHALKIPASAGKFRDSLFRIGQVNSEQATENGDWLIEIEVAPARLAQLCRENGLEINQLL